jgi:hypothetical protein
MEILISVCREPDTVADPKSHFIIYDTNKRSIITPIDLTGLNHLENITRGTGMCYNGNHFYGILLAHEHRVGSKLLIIDIKNGNRKINNLSFSKAVHSICHFTNCKHYTMLLANSTQNDTITILTINGVNLLTEDLFFDYLTHNERLKFKWNEEYAEDDYLHNNDVCLFNGDVFTSMFLNYQCDSEGKCNKNFRKSEGWQQTIGKGGAIYNLTKQTPLYENASMPHSIIWNYKGDMLFCDSGTFSLINVHEHKKVKLKGFTRGLVEDKAKNGYWVGLSHHRKFSTAVQKATLQFVDYDMNLGEELIIPDFKEIYDIVPFKPGRYNG